MKITFVRHGESEANVAGVINDDPAQPVHLTQRGRAQAESAASRLWSAPFTHAYTSEFPRARETAEILLGASGRRPHDCRLTIDSRLNERKSGMNGLPVAAFNELVSADPLHTRPDNGESFLEQMERVRSFLDEIAANYPDGVILAVSHENPMLAALALSGENPKDAVRRHLANCSEVTLSWPR